MNEFRNLGLGKKVIDVLEELGFQKPTDIQRETIPLILKGRDVIGNATTGSGKTLAFASGILEKVEPGKGIQALILTPTRELAEQITKVIGVFSKKTNLVLQQVYGGVGIERQIEGAKKAEVIIGTPGRILDHLQRKTLDFFDLKVLVLDEADRMADMGFLPDVEKIIGQCPKKRQTLLFSATTSRDIKYLEGKYMIDPVEINTEKYVDPSKLHQFYYDVPGHFKFSLLAHFLKNEKSGIILVFCNTRRNVDLVSRNLLRYKVHSHAIHGGLDQRKRNKIIEHFHRKEAEVLVCTDVAARGLDIKGVTHVYNYDVPKNPEEYIHRIGRTARAGEKGVAVNIITNKDYESFGKIMQNDSLKIEKKEMPKIEKLNPHFGDKSHTGKRSFDRGRGFGGNERDRRNSPQRPRSHNSRGDRNNSPRGRSHNPRQGGSSSFSRNRSHGNNSNRNRDSRGAGKRHDFSSRSRNDSKNKGRYRNKRR